jgi:hypothetical protein
LGARQFFLERPVTVIADKRPEAIAVEGERHAVPREELLEEGGIAMHVFGGAEVKSKNFCGGVVDGAQEHARRAARAEPGEGTAVDLHERAARGFRRTPSARLRGAARDATATPTAAPRPAEPAAGAAGTQGRETHLWRVVRELPEQCRRLLRVLLSVPPPSHEEVSAALDLPAAGIAAARDACLQDFRHRMSEFSIRTEPEDS